MVVEPCGARSIPNKPDERRCECDEAIDGASDGPPEHPSTGVGGCTEIGSTGSCCAAGGASLLCQRGGGPVGDSLAVVGVPRVRTNAPRCHVDVEHQRVGAPNHRVDDPFPGTCRNTHASNACERVNHRMLTTPDYPGTPRAPQPVSSRAVRPSREGVMAQRSQIKKPFVNFSVRYQGAH